MKTRQSKKGIFTGNGRLEVSFDGNPIDKTQVEYIFSLIKTAADAESIRYEYISIVLSGDDRLRRLNREFLNTDKSTDVLSFNLNADDNPIIEGEIYISLGKVDHQAEESGDTRMRVLLRLVAHGFLHLCGYEHDDDQSLQAMITCGEKYVGIVMEKG